jgi:ribonuclease HI
LVITSAILNIVNLIWISRNNLRFNDVKPSWNSVTSLIIAHVSLAGNQTVLSTGSSIVDFQILKAFKVNNHPPRAPRIIEVIWHPPIIGWVKCNTDGSSSGNPGPSACGGVFRNFNGDFLGCFADSIGLANALKAELWGIIFAIEAAFDRGWNNLWIESDSMVATWALKSPSLIPWQLRNRWESCLQKLNSMNFMLTHIYREGNHCADKLASLGLSRFDFTWWSCLPFEISSGFFRNRSGLAYFRFC